MHTDESTECDVPKKQSVIYEIIEYQKHDQMSPLMVILFCPSTQFKTIKAPAVRLSLTVLLNVLSLSYFSVLRPVQDAAEFNFTQQKQLTWFQWVTSSFMVKMTHIHNHRFIIHLN